MPSAAWRTTFKAHGWTPGVPPCRLTANVWSENGFKNQIQRCAADGSRFNANAAAGYVDQVSLLRLDVGTGHQYWYGMPNHTITIRYNHSTH